MSSELYPSIKTTGRNLANGREGHAVWRTICRGPGVMSPVFLLPFPNWISKADVTIVK